MYYVRFNNNIIILQRLRTITIVPRGPVHTIQMACIPASEEEANFFPGDIDFL